MKIAEKTFIQNMFGSFHKILTKSLNVTATSVSSPFSVSLAVLMSMVNFSRGFVIDVIIT